MRYNRAARTDDSSTVVVSPAAVRLLQMPCMHVRGTNIVLMPKRSLID